MLWVSNQLRADLCREPSLNEVAEAMGEKEKRIHDWQCANRHVDSADKSLSYDMDMTLYDVIEDTHIPTPDDVLNMHVRDGLLRDWMTNLADREHKIITLRFGLDDDDPWTLEAIGEEVGVTRERIRQIQVSALHKLRCLFFLKQLTLEEVL
ncbi:MAG: sigma factor-like helix-turn-helix DNA-binding protein [Mariprofundaceae bacterium]|nr:sigma factor-like helix-turn-helix DNA-binding protein [Mariprofundaceae bacterium]